MKLLATCVILGIVIAIVLVAREVWRALDEDLPGGVEEYGPNDD